MYLGGAPDAYLCKSDKPPVARPNKAPKASE